MTVPGWINAFGQRLADVVPVILLATFLVFGLQQLVPGDLAVTLAGENATPQRVQEIRDFYGLDQPLVVQYAHWLTNAARGDLSRSLLSGVPVARSIAERLPNTLLIVAGALVMAMVAGIPLGVAAGSGAIRRPIPRCQSYHRLALQCRISGWR